MKIDMNKKYRTRSGKDVCIFCTNAPGKHPVVGYIVYGWGAHPFSWDEEGRALSSVKDDPCDLIEVRSAEDVVERVLMSALLTAPTAAVGAQAVTAALRAAGLLKEDVE